MAEPAGKGGSAISGRRKAAVLMVVLGEKAAKQIYGLLPQRELRLVTEEIAAMKSVDLTLAEHVLEEFQQLSIAEQHFSYGGSEYAMRLLVEAFGKEKAEDLIQQITDSEDEEYEQLQSLQESDPVHLVKFLQNEHPQTIALVVAHLDAKKASSVLMLLTAEVRAEVVRRLSVIRQFSPEMARKIALVLHRKLASVGEQKQKSYSGFRAVADLMNRMDAEAAKKILETIEQQDAPLALQIRNLMFTFADLLSVPGNSIREVISSADKKMLALALRSANEELKEHFFRAMSSRAVEMMKEDMEALGPVRAKDIAEAQQAIVGIARKLEAEGKIQLRIEEEEIVV